MKGLVRELRLTAAEFFLSCAVDLAPRDSRMRYELAVWFKDVLERELRKEWGI